jgi:glutathione S-transferase
MKLYYATNTCSLSPAIVAAEAGIPLELEKIDLARHRAADGGDYKAVNPLGYVPVLELDDGERLTEGVAIVQYLADLKPESGLAPPAGTRERVRLQQWLTFVATELHKMFSPWLFHPEVGQAAQAFAREKLAARFAFVERRLEESPWLVGDTFTAADAYCFTIAGWARFTAVDLAPYPRLRAYLARIADRPRVREALTAHGMRKAA